MNTTQVFPAFEGTFPDLNQFILELVKAHEAGKIKSWEDLEQRVNTYFTAEKMEQMESVLPGWQKMASYSGGITLVHVMCVFLGLFLLPEVQTLLPQQQQLAKWIVLFHDVAKVHIRGKKDTMHAFRSAGLTANLLPRLGFPTTQKFPQMINSWSEYTVQAFIAGDGASAPTPDNRKLLEIFAGLDQLYGQNTPATLITKTVLLHISLDVDPFYNTPAPLTENEIKCSIDPNLLPLLKVMMLSDNEGWSLFNPETRARQRRDTLQAFQRIERLISN